MTLFLTPKLSEPTSTVTKMYLSNKTNAGRLITYNMLNNHSNPLKDSSLINSSTNTFMDLPLTCRSFTDTWDLMYLSLPEHFFLNWLAKTLQPTFLAII